MVYPGISIKYYNYHFCYILSPTFRMITIGIRDLYDFVESNYLRAVFGT